MQALIKGSLTTISSAEYQAALSDSMLNGAKVIQARAQDGETIEDALKRVGAENPDAVVLAPASSASNDNDEDEDLDRMEKETNKGPDAVKISTDMVDDFNPMADILGRPMRQLGSPDRMAIPTKVGITTMPLELSVTPRTSKVYIESKVKIGEFHNRREFIIAFDTLVFSEMDKHDYLPLANEVERSDTWATKHPPFSALGVDLNRLLELASDSRVHKQVIDIAQRVNNPPAPARDEIEVKQPSLYPVQYLAVRELITRKHLKRLGDYNQMREIARKMATVNMRLKQDRYMFADNTFVRIYKNPDRGAYRRFLNANPYMMKHEIRLIEDMFSAMVAAPSRDRSMLFAEIMNTISVRANEASFSNQLPSQLTMTSGLTFLKNLFVALAAPHLVSLEVDVRFEKNDFTFGEFIQLILLKLVLPYTVLDEEYILDIDNKIYLYLTEFFAFRTQGQTRTTARMRTQNMLTDSLRRGRGFQNMPPRAKEFLITTNMGGGWSTGANPAVPAINAEIGTFIGHMGAEYSAVTSESPDGISDPMPGRQYDNFVEFVEWFGRTHARQGRGTDKDKRAVYDILRHISLQPDNVARFGVAMQDLSAQVVRLGLHVPLQPQDKATVGFRHRIELGGGAMAFLSLTQFTDVYLNQGDMWNMISFGRSRDEWTRELTTQWKLIDRVYTNSILFSKTFKYELLQKRMRMDLGFNSSVFEEVIVNKPARYFLKFPTTGEDEDVLTIYDSFAAIIRRNPLMYGYADRFYYGAIEVHDDLMRYYVTRSGDEPRLRLDEHSLVDLVTEGRLNAVFHEAKERGDVIEINHPIFIKIEAVTARKSYPFPISATEVGQNYHVGTLTWPYSFDDDYWTDMDAVSFGVTKPDFAIDVSVNDAPILPYSISKLHSNLNVGSNVTLMRQGFEIFDEFSYDLRVRL